MSVLVAVGGLGLAVSAWSAAVAQNAVPRCRVRGSQEWLATRASPLDSAVLGTGDAIAKICYSRPQTRGRSVYDSLAPFGKAWRTGANEPTILELSAPAGVAGVPLAARRYAILTVPDVTNGEACSIPSRPRIQSSTTGPAPFRRCAPRHRLRFRLKSCRCPLRRSLSVLQTMGAALTSR